MSERRRAAERDREEGHLFIDAFRRLRKANATSWRDGETEINGFVPSQVKPENLRHGRRVFGGPASTTYWDNAAV